MLVTLSMLATGVLVAHHIGITRRLRTYVAAVRQGESPTGDEGFTLGEDGIRWLLAWVVLSALELALVDASPEAGRVAALFSLLVFVSAAYRFVPEWSTADAA